jgi:hypothetical protein
MPSRAFRRRKTSGIPIFLKERRMSTNIVAPSARATHVSDDEILGITTNGARKSAAAVSHAEVDNLFSDLASGGQGARDSDSNSDDVTDISANDSQDPSGAGERQKLNELLEANPELRNDVDDAKAYREVFVTPAEAQAATKLLGDLNEWTRCFSHSARKIMSSWRARSRDSIRRRSLRWRGPCLRWRQARRAKSRKVPRAAGRHPDLTTQIQALQRRRVTLGPQT